MKSFNKYELVICPFNPNYLKRQQIFSYQMLNDAEGLFLTAINKSFHFNLSYTMYFYVCQVNANILAT